MSAAPQESASAPPTVAEHQATRQCPYCAELVFVQAVRCKHCGSSLTPPSKVLIRAAQIVCGLEFAIGALLAFGAWTMPPGVVEPSIRVVASIGIVACSVLFYFVVKQRPWAFLAFGAFNLVCLLNGLIDGVTPQVISTNLTFVLVTWTLLTLLPALGWYQARKAALFAKRRQPQGQPGRHAA